MTIRGVYRNGQVVLDEPPPTDWPEGLAIRVEPDSEFSATTEADQGDDAASIARWLAWFDGLPAADTAAGDEVARILAERKAWQLAQWEKWTIDAELRRGQAPPLVRPTPPRPSAGPRLCPSSPR